MLANIYLNEFDQEYQKRGVVFVRYVDDIVLLAKSERAAKRLMETSTKYLVNGAYVRLKNLQIAYTLPREILQKVRMANCRVYFSGENLFVLSALPSYIDPEFVGGGRMYPQQAVYSFGVNIGF